MKPKPLDEDSIPAEPVAAARGLFKDRSPSTDDLLAERRRDLELDEEMERRLGIPEAPSKTR